MAKKQWQRKENTYSHMLLPGESPVLIYEQKVRKHQHIAQIISTHLRRWKLKTPMWLTDELDERGTNKADVPQRFLGAEVSRREQLTALLLKIRQ